MFTISHQKQSSTWASWDKHSMLHPSSMSGWEERQVEAFLLFNLLLKVLKAIRTTEMTLAHEISLTKNPALLKSFCNGLSPEIISDVGRAQTTTKSTNDDKTQRDHKRHQENSIVLYRNSYLHFIFLSCLCFYS